MAIRSKKKRVLQIQRTARELRDSGKIRLAAFCPSHTTKQRKPGTGKHRTRIEGAGKQKGVPNRITRLLKEAIIMAAELVGDPRNEDGKTGLVEYCVFLAEEHPPVFAQLLGKVLPLQIKTDGPGTTVQVIERVIVRHGEASVTPIRREPLTIELKPNGNGGNGELRTLDPGDE